MTTLSGLQERIWLDRYVRRDEAGTPIESDVDETFRRVADAISMDEAEAAEFLAILRDFRFVPGGRIIAGAGAEDEKTFYNCFVIPIETSARRHNRDYSRYDLGWRTDDFGSDSREAIFDTINTMVSIMSRGGGVGINWSVLRPQKSYLKRVSGTSSGPVGWMNVASTAVGEVEQGGSRRGAAMFMLDDWHPDLLRFIDEKRDPRKITNANISVGISDAFMEAVKDDRDWTFRFPDTSHQAYDSEWDGDIDRWVSSGYPVVHYQTVPARELWGRLTDSAWASGEPGVVFLGRYNQLSTGRRVERIICVNPCGEQGLGPYSVCNLGSLNLYSFLTYDDESEATFSWSTLTEVIRSSIKFLDNVIDKTTYFLPETERQQKMLRRIGLGTMGLADTLVALRMRYGSPEAIEFTSRVYQTMKDQSILASIAIARDKGPAGGWDESMWDRPYLAEFAERFPMADGMPLRNLFLLTQAPTGTTSLFADVNSGIEPYFNKTRTWREDRTGGRYQFPRGIEEYYERNNPEEQPSFIVDANDVSVQEHIAMQAAVQQWVDSSVSKTINAPNNQSKEDTAAAYMLAYEAGLKGLAYYRDGSRTVQVLYSTDPNERIAQLESEVAELTAKINSPFRQVQLAALETTDRNETCPDCTGKVVHEEGCMKCYNCGWSAC
jgi:ribonucleoside-diphosphate reductase alpha chain